MKSLKLSLFICIATTTIALMSCSTNPCEKVSCKNSGIATASADGKTCACVCAGNYEGDSCQTKGNVKFAGNWNVSEKLNGAATPFPSYISEVTNEATDAVSIYFKDLGQYTCSTGSYRVKATVSGKNIAIAFTTCSTDFAGTGTYNSATSMSLTYTAKYGTPSKTDNLSAVLTK